MFGINCFGRNKTLSFISEEINSIILHHQAKFCIVYGVSTILTEENNFYDFLFASLASILSSVKIRSTLKGRSVNSSL